MIEQQFLTTFNNINNYSPSLEYRNKKNNLLLDFINGTYQGSLSTLMQPDGLGTIVDDQFNFIFCSNWNKGKIDGNTFIKLANQVCIWGLWSNGMPKKFSCVRIGMYFILIPYWDYNKVKRPKKCLVCHLGKGKIYITTIQRYPQGNKSKREYSIVVQKIIHTKQKSIPQAAILINIAIQQYQLDSMSYLNYMCQQLQILKIYNLNNTTFITANITQITSQTQIKLGLLLDSKKMTIKSVGTYIIKNNSYNDYNKNYARNGYQNENDMRQNVSYDNFPKLNGLGLAKTMQNQVIIGMFKDDMLVRQLNSQQNIQKIRNNTKNYTRNLNGSVVKQILQHEHMKSINYQHNYLYFPQIKNIISKSIQMHKYVEMFERLSHQQQPQNSSTQNNSNTNINLNNNDHPISKYENNQYLVKPQQSSGSIIDQFPELKVNLNLNKDIYRDVQSQESKVRNDNNYKNHGNGNQSQFQDSNISQNKKPGFILSRSSRIMTQNSQKQRRSPIIPVKSPTAGINQKIMSRFSPSRSPLKTQYRWKR